MGIKNSELILNPDGSVYHLNLKPEHIADTIITVGDQDRVERVTAFFDEIIFETQKREFKTKTGFYKGKKMTVISTGIGIDNIDIVINELDALVNIDLVNKTPKENTKSLTIVRMGTSGSIQKDVPLDAFVVSKAGVGFDGLIHYYKDAPKHILHEATEQLIEHLEINKKLAEPYIVEADQSLIDCFDRHKNERVKFGYTGTNIGFYGPQGRVLRLPLTAPTMIDQLVDFEYNNNRITNLEMETSAIFSLSKMLGHKAISINAIIANRATGDFSENPKKSVKELIEFALNCLVED
ncbi:MAG: nucleoside phosphorylase [Bacteroidota bacterium]